MISWSTLKARGALLAAMRQYLDDRAVLEVATPVLSQSTAMDPHLQSFRVEGPSELFLQTSPESALKRVVAAYGQSVYEISHAFRADDQGALHNPEFVMLEWYEVDHNLLELTGLLTELLSSLPEPPKFWRDSVSQGIERCSFISLFEAHFAIDPNTAPCEVLAQLVNESVTEVGHLQPPYDEQFRSDCLDYLFLNCIAPELPECYFLIEFPICQAALAELDETGAFAKRFELYCQGVELANGYQELRDADELDRRYRLHAKARQDRGLSVVDRDTRLIDASANLPRCAGVALGVDRLAMVWLETRQLSDVQLFVWPNH